MACSQRLSLKSHIFSQVFVIKRLKNSSTSEHGQQILSLEKVKVTNRSRENIWQMNSIYTSRFLRLPDLFSLYPVDRDGTMYQEHLSLINKYVGHYCWQCPSDWTDQVEHYHSQDALTHSECIGVITGMTGVWCTTQHTPTVVIRPRPTQVIRVSFTPPSVPRWEIQYTIGSKQTGYIVQMGRVIVWIICLNNTLC